MPKMPRSSCTDNEEGERGGGGVEEVQKRTVAQDIPASVEPEAAFGGGRNLAFRCILTPETLSPPSGDVSHTSMLRKQGHTVAGIHLCRIQGALLGVHHHYLIGHSPSSASICYPHLLSRLGPYAGSYDCFSITSRAPRIEQ